MHGSVNCVSDPMQWFSCRNRACWQSLNIDFSRFSEYFDAWHVIKSVLLWGMFFRNFFTICRCWVLQILPSWDALFLPINLINCKMCQLFIFSTTCFSSFFCPFLFIYFSDVIANSKWPNIKICQFKHLMFSIFYTEHRRAPKLMRNANCSFLFICILHSLRFCE